MGDQRGRVWGASDSRETDQGPTKLLFPQDKLQVELGGEGEFPAVGGTGQGSVRVRRMESVYM